MFSLSLQSCFLSGFREKPLSKQRVAGWPQGFLQGCSPGRAHFPIFLGPQPITTVVPSSCCFQLHLLQRLKRKLTAKRGKSRHLLKSPEALGPSLPAGHPHPTHGCRTMAPVKPEGLHRLPSWPSFQHLCGFGSLILCLGVEI